MQSYPLGKTNFATRVTSASIAASATFLNARVNTASFALNAPGPSGSSGSVYTNIGAVGPQGPIGPQGPKGLGVYLLSSTIASCSYAFSLGYSAGGTAQDACVAVQSTYYSAATVLANDVYIYFNTKRTVAAFAGYYSNGSNAWFTDGDGRLYNESTCTGGGEPPPSPPGGGGGCSGTCFDGVGCEVGCYCSTNEGAGVCSDQAPI